MERWLYTGQPIREWPPWLVFRNFAHSPETGRIVIHAFERTQLAFPGDRIELRPDQQLIIHPEAPWPRSSTPNPTTASVS